MDSSALYCFKLFDAETKPMFLYRWEIWDLNQHKSLKTLAHLFSKRFFTLAQDRPHSPWIFERQLQNDASLERMFRDLFVTSAIFCQHYITMAYSAGHHSYTRLVHIRLQVRTESKCPKSKIQTGTSMSRIAPDLANTECVRFQIL